MNSYNKKLIKKIFKKLGLDIKRTKENESENKIEYQQLMRLPDISTLIDIGVGHQGTPFLYKYFPNSNYVFIDPLQECREAVQSYLDDPKNQFIIAGLGSEEKEEKINVAKDIAHSSLLERTPLTHKGDPQEKRLIKIRRLDNIIDEIKCTPPFGIKIDTEGYELEVIKGATNALRSSLFVIMEVRHIKTSFYNSYSYSELIKIMHKNGFLPSIILYSETKMSDVVFQPISDL